MGAQRIAADALAVVREARARVIAPEHGNYTQSRPHQITYSPKLLNNAQALPISLLTALFLSAISQNSYNTYDYSCETPQILPAHWHKWCNTDLGRTVRTPNASRYS